MSNGCRETGNLSFSPNRVRHDEIEKSAFFGGLLLFEQPVHVSREFEQPDACVHVLAVSGTEAVDICLDPRLVLPIFARLSFELGKVNSAVEPVFIHNVQAVL